MARKDGSTLLRGAEKGAQRPADTLLGILKDVSAEVHAGARKSAAKRGSEKSWAAVGIDTSMTACSAVAMGYDGTLARLRGPVYREIRWTPDDDYYKRLGEAARGYEMIVNMLSILWVIDPDKVHIACEEPFFFGVGAKQRQTGQWIKQQAEVAGAFKGGLVRFGYKNIREINNSQWHATLRRDGVAFERVPANAPKGDKEAARRTNKFVVKEWAIKAFGLPDLPDLVKSKSGAKIPRPESGFGAKAKAEQPNDIYDAAACCAWILDEIENGRV